MYVSVRRAADEKSIDFIFVVLEEGISILRLYEVREFEMRHHSATCLEPLGFVLNDSQLVSERMRADNACVNASHKSEPTMYKVDESARAIHFL